MFVEDMSELAVLYENKSPGVTMRVFWRGLLFVQKVVSSYDKIPKLFKLPQIY